MTSPLHHHGRVNPNTEAPGDETVPTGYVDTRRAALLADPASVRAAAAAETTTMCRQQYIDDADSHKATRASVDAADALYLPKTALGVTVAKIAVGGKVDPAQLPPLTTSRFATTVTGPTTTPTPTLKTVTDQDNVPILAATLAIPDPGWAYHPLVFAALQGRPTDAVGSGPTPRGVASGPTGLIEVKNTVGTWASGLADPNPRDGVYYRAVPHASLTPRSGIDGPTTMSLYVSVYTGTGSYRFLTDTLLFYALLFPATRVGG